MATMSNGRAVAVALRWGLGSGCLGLGLGCAFALALAAGPAAASDAGAASVASFANSVRTAAHPSAACTEATEWVPRLCPSGLPKLAALKVDRTTQQCPGFALGPRGARRYFARAWQLADPRGESAVERSPCAASGSLRLADGRKASWRIEQIGTATLVLDATGERLTLLCPDCNFPPFAAAPAPRR